MYSRGGRFTSDPESLDPAVDEESVHVVADLVDSQSLVRIGFVKGGGCAACADSGVSTDGLRALLVFEERAIRLAEIDFFDWERIVHYR